MDDLPERKPYLLLLKFDFTIQINSLRKNWAQRHASRKYASATGSSLSPSEAGRTSIPRTLRAARQSS